jgi:hypothetical protein
MATQTTLCGYAINTAVAMQNALLAGASEPSTKGDIVLLLGLVNLLAQAILNNGGGTIPASMLTGRFSATQSSTSAIQT